MVDHQRGAARPCRRRCMGPLIGMLIGIAIGGAGALAGVWFGFKGMLAMIDRIDAEAAKEEAGR